MTNETKPPREVWCLVNDSGEAWDGTSDQELASSIVRMAAEQGEGPQRVERYIHAAAFDEAEAWLRKREDISGSNGDSFVSGDYWHTHYKGEQLAYRSARLMLERLRDGGEP